MMFNLKPTLLLQVGCCTLDVPNGSFSFRPFPFRPLSNRPVPIRSDGNLPFRLESSVVWLTRMLNLKQARYSFNTKLIGHSGSWEISDLPLPLAVFFVFVLLLSSFLSTMIPVLGTVDVQDQDQHQDQEGEVWFTLLYRGRIGVKKTPAIPIKSELHLYLSR